MEPRTKKIVSFFLITRGLYMFVFIPILHYSFTRYNLPIDESKHWFDKWLDFLSPWDGRHFAEIIDNGYVYERQHVFFPLFPKIVSAVSYAVPEVPCILWGIVLSNLLSLATCYQMHELTRMLFNNERFADYSTLFFTLNVCTRFYLSLYTESTYTYLQMLVLFLIFYHKDHSFERVSTRRLVAAFLLVAVNISCRSNALLLWFVPGYVILLRFIRSLYARKYANSWAWLIFGITAILTLLSVLYILTGYMPYQIYWSGDDMPEWWNSAIPNLYSYVRFQSVMF